MQMMRSTSKRVLASAVVFGCALPWALADILTVGAGGTYADLEAALAVAVADDTVRFLDSATYTMANDLSITSKSGLTIESAPGQRAILNFTGDLGANNNNYWGIIYGSNQTIRDVDIRFGRVTALVGGGTNTTIEGVNFVMTGCGTCGSAGQVGMETANDVSVLYSTFYGTAAGGGGGIGISLSANNTGVLGDHVSFDNLYIPIRNTNPNADMTLLNSAVGAFHSASWNGVFILADSTATEDYNAVYGPSGLIDPTQAFKLTSGGNPIDADNYIDVFVGDPSTGDWTVDASLYTAAGDGTTIGAWQVPEPSTLALLAAGAVALHLRRRRL